MSWSLKRHIISISICPATWPLLPLLLFFLTSGYFLFTPARPMGDLHSFFSQSYKSSDLTSPSQFSSNLHHGLICSSWQPSLIPSDSHLQPRGEPWLCVKVLACDHQSDYQWHGLWARPSNSEHGGARHQTRVTSDIPGPGRFIPGSLCSSGTKANQRAAGPSY